MDVSQDDRDAVLALVTETLHDAIRTTSPPETEQHDWLPWDVEWSELDAGGWVTRLSFPSVVWVPKALVGWKLALELGNTLNPELPHNPQLSLARWPAVEAAVRGLYAAWEV